MATLFSILAMDRGFHGQRSLVGTVHGAAENWTECTHNPATGSSSLLFQLEGSNV